jgi:hypothetical protein
MLALHAIQEARPATPWAEVIERLNKLAADRRSIDA